VKPRVRAIGAVTAMALLVCIAACGPDADPAPSGSPDSSASSTAGPPAATTSIEFQLRAEPAEAAVYQAVVDAYMQEHPETSIEMVPLSGDEHLTRLTTAFASGEPPDVFLLNYREYAPFVQRGAVDPVESYLELDTSAYFPAPLEAFSIQGALQCMPQNVSSLVVYYNRELFAAAGLTSPVTSWTWDDFADAARALTTDTVHGVGLDPRLRRLAPFVWSNGGEIVDDTLQPTAMTLTEPAAREALAMLVALQDEGVSPDGDDVAAAGLDEQFMNGTLAMYLGSRSDTPQFRDRDLDFDIAPLPVLKKPVSVLNSDAYCIAAGTNNAEEAAAFVAYATGPQGQAIAALGGPIVPSLISVAESAAFLDPTVKPASSQVFLDAVPFLRRTPVITTWTEVEDVVDGLLAQAFYDARSLDEVLVEIAEAASPLLAAGAVRQ
jgi:multiple sugar transport system substrate-binding protein